MVKSDAEWEKILTPMQYRVLREKATERPGSGEYDKHFARGVYTCAGCGQELFRSDDKYDAGCGWPSFMRSADAAAVAEQKDHSLGMTRTEILCSRCGGHLGHVFDDGPQPTGLRYCVNSASLRFDEAAPAAPAAGPKRERATFGTGCFWCTEALFERLDGVESVTVGYMGGDPRRATYKEVCTGTTGHAEVARIEFDPATVSFDRLLDLFWRVHDPTTLNRQGADVGPQYRSVIFYENEKQKTAAEASKAALAASGTHKDPIVTEITSASTFHEAEDYHQNYYRQNPQAPYCRAVILPKLRKLGNGGE